LTAGGLPFDALNLSDAGFPTGAHGHSSGLEYAVQKAWVRDRGTFEAWCAGALRSSFIPLDLRAALRSWHSCADQNWRWQALNEDLAAFRTSRLQRESSAQVGRSFLRSAGSCYPERLGSLPVPEKSDDVQLPVAWALVFRRLGLSAEAMARTLVFGAVRQWTQVAMRIVPLGQKDAFAAQTRVLAELPTLQTDPSEARRPLESFAPGFDIAGLGMELLEKKYFRS
jgi:urease accessory protein